MGEFIRFLSVITPLLSVSHGKIGRDHNDTEYHRSD